MRRSNGSQSMPSVTGMTPTYRPISAIRPKNDEVGGGRLDRGVDRVRDRPAGRGQQPDLVGLALDPRIARPERRASEPADRLVGAARNSRTRR